MSARTDLINEIIAKLDEWGVELPTEIQQDLRDEFDVMDDGIDQNRVGKFSRKSKESRAAALKIFPKTGTQRRRVYDYIVQSRGGRTREEI